MTHLEPAGNQVQTFTFAGVELRAVLVDGSPWFVGLDLAQALEYRDARDALRSVRDRNKGTQIVRTPGGQQECLCVNEPGLYQLIMKSRSANAEIFQDWVTDEVLPSIRKTGSYAPEYQSPAHRILAMAQAAVDHEERLAELARHAEEVDRRMYISEARLDSIEHNAGTYTVLAYAKLCGVTVSSAEAARLGKAATALYRQRVDMEPAKVRDERYGLVNLYPENMLQEVFQDFGFMLRPGGGLVAR